MSARRLPGLDFADCEVAILASGESLTPQQCDAVMCWRVGGHDRRALAINTTFRRALWADGMYACDGNWWNGRERSDRETYGAEVNRTFAGSKWTQDKDAAKRYGVRYIESEAGRGFAAAPDRVNQGFNSGFQAIDLAYKAGARRVYLLGYDMHGEHWHGRHPGLLHRNMRFDLFLQRLDELAAQVAKMPDFAVINCTPGSALRSFPMMDWRDVFERQEVAA